LAYIFVADSSGLQKFPEYISNSLSFPDLQNSLRFPGFPDLKAPWVRSELGWCQVRTDNIPTHLFFNLRTIYRIHNNMHVLHVRHLSLTTRSVVMRPLAKGTTVLSATITITVSEYL